MGLERDVRGARSRNCDSALLAWEHVIELSAGIESMRLPSQCWIIVHCDWPKPSAKVPVHGQQEKKGCPHWQAPAVWHSLSRCGMQVHQRMLGIAQLTHMGGNGSGSCTSPVQHAKRYRRCPKQTLRQERVLQTGARRRTHLIGCPSGGQCPPMKLVQSAMSISRCAPDHGMCSHLEIMPTSLLQKTKAITSIQFIRNG